MCSFAANFESNKQKQSLKATTKVAIFVENHNIVTIGLNVSQDESLLMFYKYVYSIKVKCAKVLKKKRLLLINCKNSPQTSFLQCAPLLVTVHN